jgi:monoterpene epsilon-lactone hydrolase
MTLTENTALTVRAVTHGTRDMLLSATVRTHRKPRAQGVTAELRVYDGQSHADYLRAYPAPETHDAMADISRFFDRDLKP